MIALHYCLITGEGQHIDVSIQECVTAPLMETQTWELTQSIPPRSGLRVARAQLTPLLLYRCKDGYISWRVYAANLGYWTNGIIQLMKEWGEAEPEVADIDFTTLDMNFVDQATLDVWETAFARFFAEHTKAELFKEAIERNILLFPVSTTGELVSSEQLKFRDFWVRVEHPELDDTIAYPGAPLKLGETPWRISRRPPLIGEHNEEIYTKELAMTEQQLRQLKELGIV